MPGTIDIRESVEGLLLPVLGQPGARRNAVVGIHDGRLKIAVTQVAEKGKANKEILKVLAEFLDLPKGNLSVAAGDTTSRKTILVKGLNREQLASRLGEMLQG